MQVSISNNLVKDMLVDVNMSPIRIIIRSILGIVP